MRQTVPMRSTIYVFQVHMHDQPRAQQLTVALFRCCVKHKYDHRYNIYTYILIKRRVRPRHLNGGQVRIETAKKYVLFLLGSLYTKCIHIKLLAISKYLNMYKICKQNV